MVKNNIIKICKVKFNKEDFQKKVTNLDLDEIMELKEFQNKNRDLVNDGLKFHQIEYLNHYKIIKMRIFLMKNYYFRLTIPEILKKQFFKKMNENSLRSFLYRENLKYKLRKNYKNSNEKKLRAIELFRRYSLQRTNKILKVEFGSGYSLVNLRMILSE